MKKITSVLFVLMVAGTMVFATGTFEITSERTNVEFVKNGSVVKIFYKSDILTNTKICIKNSVGENVITDFVKSQYGFIKAYNFNSLSAGAYTITVSDVTGVYSAEILIKQERKLIYKEHLPIVNGLPVFQFRQQLHMNTNINPPNNFIKPLI